MIRGHFEDAMKRHGEIVEIHRHAENPRYTAHIKLPNVEKIEAFTNLTAVSINEYMPEGQEIDEDDIEYAYPKKTVPSKASNRKSGGSEKKKGATTFDNLMDNGGTIIDKKPTQRGTFSIHVQMPDGTKHNFSSIGGEKLDAFLEE